MKLRNDEIVALVDRLGGPEGSTLAHKRLPFPLSYALLKNRKALAAAYNDYQDILVGLLEQHGLTLDDLKGKPMPKDAAPEIQELLKKQEDVDIRTVNVADLEGTDWNKMDSLSAADIELLEFMILEG